MLREEGRSSWISKPCSPHFRKFLKTQKNGPFLRPKKCFWVGFFSSPEFILAGEICQKPDDYVCGWLSGCVDDQGPDVWIWGSRCTDDYPDVWMTRVQMCGFQDPDVWMTRVRLSRWRRLMPPPMGKKSLHTGVEVTHNKSADVAPQDRHISITLVVKSWWSMFDFREEKLREKKWFESIDIKSSKDCL